MQYLTQDELIALLKTAKAESTRDWLMILMAVNHGLRASEVVDIRLGDLTKTEIKVRRLKKSISGTQKLEDHPGNTLFNEVKGIAQWRVSRRTNAGDFLFPVSYKTFYRNFVRYAEAIGLPPEKRHPHILKHTTATYMHEGNVDPIMIKTKLGHASINSTMQYIHSNPAKADEAFHNVMMEKF